MNKTVDLMANFLSGDSINEGCTEVSLSLKQQNLGDSWGGSLNTFGRGVITVSPSSTLSTHLYIGDNSLIDATLYAGWDSIDVEQDPYMMGFLVCTDKDKQKHAVKLDNFCVLAETEKNTEYIFSMFSQADGRLFSVILPSLEDIEFGIKNGKVEIIKAADVDLMQKSFETSYYIKYREAQIIGDNFNEMLDLLAKGDKRRKDKPGKSSSFILPADALSALPPIDVDCFIKQFKDIWEDTCTGLEHSSVISFAGDALKDVIPCDFDKTTTKVQKAKGVNIPLGRTVIKATFLDNKSMYMYIGQEDFLPVIVCVGRSRNPHLFERYDKIALLFFEYEPGKVTFAILKELVVLSVIDKNSENEIGVLTVLKKDISNGEKSASDILLIKPLIGSPDLSHVNVIRNNIPAKNRRTRHENSKNMCRVQGSHESRKGGK